MNNFLRLLLPLLMFSTCKPSMRQQTKALYEGVIQEFVDTIEEELCYKVITREKKDSIHTMLLNLQEYDPDITAPYKLVITAAPLMTMVENKYHPRLALTLLLLISLNMLEENNARPSEAWYYIKKLGKLVGPTRELCYLTALLIFHHQRHPNLAWIGFLLRSIPPSNTYPSQALITGTFHHFKNLLKRRLKSGTITTQDAQASYFLATWLTQSRYNDLALPYYQIAFNESGVPHAAFILGEQALAKNDIITATQHYYHIQGAQKTFRGLGYLTVEKMGVATGIQWIQKEQADLNDLKERIQPWPKKIVRLPGGTASPILDT